MRYKKNGVHQEPSGLFDLEWLRYLLVFGSQNALTFGLCLLAFDSYYKLHTRSKKAHFTTLAHNIYYLNIDNYE